MRYFNEFERYLERQMDTSGYRRLPLDVTESEEGYVVNASVPGINPDDVEITIEEDVLTIKGEFSKDSEIEEETYLIRERRAGSFSRSIRFPVEVNAEAVDAIYENGVLTLNVPKVEEVKPKRVEIKVS
jgi:HSP20 family protein